MLASAPTYVSWNYTYSCNFSCDHCCSRADWHPAELSTSEYRQIAQHLADTGVLRVGFGGGEPLIREDAVEILQLLSQNHIDTNITTNAWFLDQTMAQSLADAKLGTLYVSLDAPTALEHDRIRRQGSFVRALEGIRNAQQAGIHRIILSTVVTRINMHSMAGFTQSAKDLNLFGIEFKRFRPVGNGLANEETFSLKGMDHELHDTVRALKEETPEVQIDLIYSAETDSFIQ